MRHGQIVEWLEQRAELMMDLDAGIAAELAICAVAIRGGNLGPNGMLANEPVLIEGDHPTGPKL